MKLTQKQQQLIAHANARLNLVDGSVRSGKTIGLNFRFLKYVMGAEPEHDYKGQGELLIVGVTAQTAYRNIVIPMAEAVGKNLRYNSGQQKITLYGRDIFIFGAADAGSESKIRGMTVAAALVDELTLIHETFFRQLITRMSVDGAKLFGSTNPDNPKHYIKKDYIDRADELDLFHQHYTLEDNAENLPGKYVEELKKELSGAFYDRFILGKWVATDGLVYSFFEEREPFMVESREAMETERYYIAGVDYGIQNPTALEIMAIDERAPEGKPSVMTIDEYVYCGREMLAPKTDSELADDIEDKLRPYREKLHAVYIDPSASSLIEELKRRGIPVKHADNNVTEGIKTVTKMNKTGKYCILKGAAPTLVEERYLYKWDAKAAANQGIDKPRKEDDHASDAERYAIHTHFAGRGAGISTALSQW